MYQPNITYLFILVFTYENTSLKKYMPNKWINNDVKIFSLHELSSLGSLIYSY
jgi:hypothetical protein